MQMLRILARILDPPSFRTYTSRHEATANDLDGHAKERVPASTPHQGDAVERVGPRSIVWAVVLSWLERFDCRKGKKANVGCAGRTANEKQAFRACSPLTTTAHPTKQREERTSSPPQVSPPVDAPTPRHVVLAAPPLRQPDTEPPRDRDRSPHAALARRNRVGQRGPDG